MPIRGYQFIGLTELQTTTLKESRVAQPGVEGVRHTPDNWAAIEGTYLHPQHTQTGSGTCVNMC